MRHEAAQRYAVARLRLQAGRGAADREGVLRLARVGVEPGPLLGGSPGTGCEMQPRRPPADDARRRRPRDAAHGAGRGRAGALRHA